MVDEDVVENTDRVSDTGDATYTSWLILSGGEPGSGEFEDALRVEEFSSREDSTKADEATPLEMAQEIQQTDILYLTDGNDTEAPTERHGVSDRYSYLDKELHRAIASGRYANIHFQPLAHTLELNDTADFGVIDYQNGELQELFKNGDYDKIRAELDEAFDSERHASSIRANIVTATAAALTAGIVSYLLRVGSLIASMMSSIPIWRGFDPIAILVLPGKKKKKDRDQKADGTEQATETLFDGETE